MGLVEIVDTVVPESLVSVLQNSVQNRVPVYQGGSVSAFQNASYAQNPASRLNPTDQAILMRVSDKMRGTPIPKRNVSAPTLPHTMQAHHLQRNMQQNGVLNNNAVLGNWGLQKKKGRR